MPWYEKRMVRPGKRGSSPPADLHSISYTQRPDIAIEAAYPSGERAVYLFDLKYKLDAEREGSGDSPGEIDLAGEHSLSGEPRKPDFDKMPAYRDAIRDPDGRRVVQYAAILYPGWTRRFCEGMEAIGVRPRRMKGLSRTMGQNILRRVMRGQNKT